MSKDILYSLLKNKFGDGYNIFFEFLTCHDVKKKTNQWQHISFCVKMQQKMLHLEFGNFYVGVFVPFPQKKIFRQELTLWKGRGKTEILTCCTLVSALNEFFFQMAEETKSC